MRFGVLGPLLVGAAGTSELGSLKRQVLIAMLLRGAGRPVSPYELMAAAWRDKIHDVGNNVLHWHIHKVRHALDDPKRLVLRDGGYVLNLGPDELDVSDFEAWYQAGVRAMSAEDWTSAGQQFIAAEGLWRGSAYEGLEFVPALHAEAKRLAELRLAAVEHRFTADLNLGRHERLIPELTKLVDLHPFRDTMRGRLMLALYRSGRQADALDLYRQGRELSIEKLGIELGPELGRLERDILNQEPRLSAPEPPITVRSSPAAPIELPRTPSTFTGRDGQVAAIRAALLDARVRRGGLVVVSGIAGSGKSTLAIHAARQVNQKFPDGQLYADLGGGVDDTVRPEDILTRFLRSLGVALPPQRLSRDELAARFRTATTNRRILIVADNVGTMSQVRHLLPAAGTSAVLITGRPSLAGLVDAEHVTAPMLGETEAVELFARSIGSGRVMREHGSTALLSKLCGYHPLALSIIAAKLKARPDEKIESMVSRLRDHTGRGLDEFTVNDWSLRKCFDAGFRTLGPDTAVVFALLGVAAGSVFTARTAATLAGTGIPDAEAAMEELVDSGLMIRVGDDGYETPRLIRRYAHEHAVSLPDAERSAAVSRLRATRVVATPLAHN